MRLFYKVFFLLNKLKCERGCNDMAMCYVTCIVAGTRTYEQVPRFLKAKVKELLISMELEDLLPENERPVKVGQ